MPDPEALAREQIDAALEAAGWRVQDASATNLYASSGVAIREFPLATGYGEADYLLFAGGQAVGVVEAKKQDTPLTGVELQSVRYGQGLPERYPAPVRPLPFLYESTGVETRFTNRLDPEPRSRRVSAFHRPETMDGWVSTPLAVAGIAEGRPRYDARATLRARLQTMPPIDPAGLWPAQLTAVGNLEESLKADRPRALIQMATGSGKTFTAITSIYRLVKYGGATRVLFLVDRANLGKQAEKEFQQYTAPDDGRKFTELYVVQRLTSNRIDPAAKVVITTIQRLYSMLRGEADLDPELEERSLAETMGGQGGAMAALKREPLPVSYNPAIPIETFDVIFTDECHRSIYNLWRQVLEYFDAFLVGLTATPSKQTIGFFAKNLVMEYTHEQAVADGVNVDFDVFRIRTEITERGSTVDADFWVDRRDRATRELRAERLDAEFTYGANELDRAVVARDQIRTVVRAFRDNVLTQMFPGRQEVPKTLVFAKDDSHADDVVQIVREEFGRGNDFAQKITYRTDNPEQQIRDFRTGYFPRVAVTVDMIATGTDIKPVEIVVFIRSVKSPGLFEQMKGRGVRVINQADFQGVNPNGTKDHFVIVDCVGVCEQELVETKPLETQRGVSLDKLLEAVAFGAADPEVLSSLASRLSRLERRLGGPAAAAAALGEAAAGTSLAEIAAGIVAALDPDRQEDDARALATAAGLPPDDLSPELVAQARTALLRAAAKPLAANPALRTAILDTQRRTVQTIDAVSQDTVLEAGFSEAAREKARALTASFERFIAANADEIAALQVLYARPYADRLRLADIRALADSLKAPPRSWTPDALWRAYETLDRSKVRGSGTRVLTDLVTLVRFATGQDPALAPFADGVNTRFAAWLAAQEAGGRRFTPEQRRWLEAIRDHVATSLRIDRDDFDYTPFTQHGGLGKVYQVFGDELPALLDELNEVLVA